MFNDRSLFSTPNFGVHVLHFFLIPTLRYEVVEANPLGCGTFGIVAKCFDHKLGLHVAVKISRNNEFYHAQARVEKWLLEKFMDLSGDKHGIGAFSFVY